MPGSTDMTAPRALARDDDRLVEEVADVIARESGMRCGLLRLDTPQQNLCRNIARAALTVARAHFAALSRQHGAAIRGRIDMGDGPATVERFEQRALVAHEIATLIKGKST